VNASDSQPAPIAEHLKRLMLLRSVLACVLGVSIGIAVLGFDVHLRWRPMGAALALLLGANLIAQLRIQRAQRIPEAELFVQLLLDIGVLCVLLYLSGGSTNPFVSLYLLPLVIAATTLPPRYAWSMAAVTAVCYGLLFFFYLPLTTAHSGHADAFHVHVIGMWANFVLSAGLIAFFVTRMARAIRTRDAELARQKESALRNERIVALGTLAAGAAHELGTPLSTMAVVLNDMAQDHAGEADLSRDLATLRQQVAACKETITRMVAAAGGARAEGGGAHPVDEFLRETLDNWRLLRPSVTLAERLSGPAPAPTILNEHTLRQAIVNLLDNAADASPHSVELDCSWGVDRLRLEIRDRGPGLDAEAQTRAGRGFFSTKAQGQGNGIGLLLAKATFERLGGELRLDGRSGGGVRTLLELPLGSLMARQHG